MEFNKFYNKDVLAMVDDMVREGVVVDCVLTSPPYNTSRPGARTEVAIKGRHASRYGDYHDTRSDDEYLEWMVGIVGKMDKVLADNGVMLWNLSYATDSKGVKGNNPHEVMWRMINDVIMDTPFTVADCIVWKKSSAMPNNASPNKLTRIVEFVFVIVRKKELMTFKSNKQVKSVSKRGQNFYENVFNFIEAPNNDGKTDINQATFSSDFVKKLIDIYVEDGGVVYDPFMGTGTTAIGVIKSGRGISYIGSEISKEQVDYSNKRVDEFFLKQ